MAGQVCVGHCPASAHSIECSIDVRHSLVQACDIPLDHFPVIVEQEGAPSRSRWSLVGVDLPGLLCPLARHCLLLRPDQWPLTLFSVGPCYGRWPSIPSSSSSSPSFRQRDQLAFLVLSHDPELVWRGMQTISANLASIFSQQQEFIFPHKGVTLEECAPLDACERSAHLLKLGHHQLARFSNIESFVSQRLKIKVSDPDNNSSDSVRWAEMSFGRFDLNLLVQCLMGDALPPE